ncbi:MAG: tRNA (adenosine(37)-N6)-threonylcarbamoyltransferase complex dimerization subunit type 1 TsaB [Christensenellaceae bacterium]|nr:tRNA (adenosine(37)-N6)-threonylcarbamoyltransferase complex dimerization subunit type 1 TsaB [Christensenellaceae bacterium]
MNILSIDTSGGVCTAAVLADNRLLSEVYMDGRRTHSETLGVMVDQCLKYAELTAEDIDLFACAIGPGSFTGLRIGVGFIKGLAHASHRPTLGVNTLDALARNAAGFDALVCPIIDARREEVYTATYEDGSLKSHYRAMPLKNLLAELDGKRVLFLGDAALKYREKICSACPSFTVAHPGIALQRAGSVGLCAFDMYESGERQDVYSLEPFYLRETQAERVYAEKQRGAK